VIQTLLAAGATATPASIDSALAHRELEAVRALALPLTPSLAGRVADNFRDYHVLATRDDQNLSRLATQLDSRRLLLVPQLDDDVHDIEGLARIHQYLFASQAERERLIEDLVA